MSKNMENGKYYLFLVHRGHFYFSLIWKFPFYLLFTLKNCRYFVVNYFGFNEKLTYCAWFFLTVVASSFLRQFTTSSTHFLMLRLHKRTAFCATLCMYVWHWAELWQIHLWRGWVRSMNAVSTDSGAVLFRNNTFNQNCLYLTIF